MVQMTVCKATNADLPQLGRTIARAFQDDPALAWAAPDAQRRERFGPRYFEVLIEHTYLPKGEVYLTKDGATGTLWAPPGKWQASVRGMLPLLPVMVRAGGISRGRCGCRGSWRQSIRINPSRITISRTSAPIPLAGEKDMGARFWLTCCDVATLNVYRRTWRPPVPETRSSITGMGLRSLTS
jgi:hypothetical protein